MRLQNLTERGETALARGADREVLGLTMDSREVKQGFLFVAIPGTQQDGRAFLQNAIAAGATSVLVPEGTDLTAIPENVAVLTAPNIRRALSSVASRFYPRQPACIAAVTGTSGKTSTVQFARQLWTKDGHKSASLGTLGLISPDENHYGSLTTPDPVTLHKILDETAEKNVTHLAMEASSHGIELNRLDFVRLQIAAFTNLGRDHMDYHVTEENYFTAKRRLFTDLLPRGSTAVLNADSPYFAQLLATCAERGHKVIGFGAKSDDIRLLAQNPDPRGQILKLKIFGKAYEIRLPLIGAFQAWNALCALGIALGTGVPQDKAMATLEKLEGVPGRLELIGHTKSGGTVFVDYAHKPPALESVLETLRPHITSHSGARLHVAFGCGGNRDKGKRPIMGEIAQRLADEVIVTDDNPRKEEADTIRKEILAGCKASPHLREIGDRALAIEEGIKALRKNDILVIAGKGHEEGQIVGDKILPFNDAEVARRFLKKEKLLP
jgi:UDP-N-acetylmuramoyl-L-alanyl-D-glutamate--2,6-diaminopimelate ligase